MSKLNGCDCMSTRPNTSPPPILPDSKYGPTRPEFNPPRIQPVLWGLFQQAFLVYV